MCRWEISVSEDTDAPGLPVFRGLRHSDGEVAQSPGQEPGVAGNLPDSGSAKAPAESGWTVDFTISAARA